jgi:phenylacetate-coenzyme A ligase PaaK-like adenylate-forming protein
MLETALAQLRFATSMLLGTPFSLRALDRLVEGVLDTRREFGAVSPAGADLVNGPALDAATRQEVQLRRFRKQARRAAQETAYYAGFFQQVGLDPAHLSWADIARLPLTPKAAIRDHADQFVCRTARPALRTTTTGTTGKPTSVCFSEYELAVTIALGAIAMLFDGSVTPEDIVQISSSSRATLGNFCFAGSCAQVGATVCPVGLVDPEITLALLAEEHHIPGKKRRVSVLQTYPSYLGELIETGLRLGYGPSDFGLERIVVGGEIVTAGVQARCRRLFGSVQFRGGYGMTEIWPFGGRLCEQDHLHFEPSQGLLEVYNPQTGTAARPGETGIVVATPFAPYRDATVVLRYDTQDVVRVLPDSPTCSLRNLPATSNLLGKLKLSVPYDGGWVYVRDVAEALEAVDEVPLPARYSFWAMPGGVGVEVVTRSQGAAVRGKVEAGLLESGVPLRELHLLDDRSQLRNPVPLRGDLRELSFAAPQPPILSVA